MPPYRFLKALSREWSLDNSAKILYLPIIGGRYEESGLSHCQQILAGRFFVDESCIYCDFCVQVAPANFSYDEAGGFAYFSKQPSSAEELEQVAESLDACPTESIGDSENYKPNCMHHTDLRPLIWTIAVARFRRQ